MVVLSVFGLITLLGCAAPMPHGQTDRLNFSLGGEITVLNPILSTDSVSAAVESAIFSGLITFNENLEPVPDLAKSWAVSSDGKVWTFKLRQDVKWHDGVPFTAADVIFTFNAILNPKVNSVRRSDYIIDGQPIVFSAPDKYTVMAKLPKSFAPFLIHAAMGIIPKHLLTGKDINTANFNQQPVGTGPFKFKEWQTGDHVLLVRNQDYYLGQPILKEILYKIIPDENSALVVLEAGEIDTTGIPAKDYSRMKSAKGIKVYQSEALLYTYLGFNLANPKFKDKRVRQALAYATDKKQLVGLILRGLGAPAYAPSAPISWAYSQAVPQFAYNPEKAKSLLKEAGVKSLEFTILVNQGNKEREKAAVILQQQYAKVGVKVNVRVLEWSAILKIVNANKDPKDFEAIIMGWSLGLDPDCYSIWHSSQYPRGFNFIRYQNGAVDRLIEEGRTTTNQEKRKEVYAKLWQLIAADQPYIFLWYPKEIVGVRDNIGGLAKPGPAGLFLHLEKVYKK